MKVTTKNLEKKQAQFEEFLSLLPKAGQSWVSTVKGLPKLQDPVRQSPVDSFMVIISESFLGKGDEKEKR